jgi:crotonobetainyl-CoA:carnitine CoA-transferase CaiB-like acyl-CoA transferase
MTMTGAWPAAVGQHSGPLAGVRVLDISEIIAAPFCAMLLSDMGADVIKVEPPEGESWRLQNQFMPGESKGFMSLNRGKRGLAVDLKTPEGREIVHALAREADVVVVNYRPDVPPRLGIDYETLCALNPRLIYASNTAFGRHGPDARRPGYDIILQAASGLMSAAGTATAAGVPQTIGGTAVVDFSAALTLAWAISAALYARERTGVGQQIDTSLFGAALAVQTTRFFAIAERDTEQRAALLERLTEMRAEGRPYPEIAAAASQAKGIASPGTNLYYRCYQTADGFIAVAALSQPLRDKFCGVLGLHDPRQTSGLMTPGSEEARQEALRLVGEAETVFRTRSTDDWLARFDAAGVPAGPVRFIDELFDDPQVQANGLLVEVEHPLVGPLQMVGPPVRMSHTPLQPQGASPTLGQHTDEILTALGYDRGRIDDLRARGIVR